MSVAALATGHDFARELWKISIYHPFALFQPVLEEIQEHDTKINAGISGIVLVFMFLVAKVKRNIQPHSKFRFYNDHMISPTRLYPERTYIIYRWP